MCLQKMTDYSCGHTYPGAIVLCPITLQAPIYRPCTIRRPYPVPDANFCNACRRAQWNMDIIKTETEHGELHEQGLCKCSCAFTNEDRERLAKQYQKRSKEAKLWRQMNGGADGVEPKSLGRGNLAAQQLPRMEDSLNNGTKQEITYQEQHYWNSGPPDYVPLDSQHVKPPIHASITYQQFNPQAQTFKPQSQGLSQYNSVSMVHQNFILQIRDPGPQTAPSQPHQISRGHLPTNTVARIGTLDLVFGEDPLVTLEQVATRDPELFQRKVRPPKDAVSSNQIDTRPMTSHGVSGCPVVNGSVPDRRLSPKATVFQDPLSIQYGSWSQGEQLAMIIFGNTMPKRPKSTSY